MIRPAPRHAATTPGSIPHPFAPMLRGLAAPLVVFLFTVLAACSGGSADKSTGSGGSSTCQDQGSFCLVTCNLGCTLTGGCGITDIAQNQPLVFTFSRDVDPRTVDFTSFSIKTLTGEEPVGQFLVEGQTVSFIPDVRFVQGQTFFGFAPNVDYILTLPGGSASATAIRSTAGQRLLHDYSCTLRVTRGVVDLDQRSPEAQLVTPSTTFNVATDTPVVMEFSELIDFAPFSNPPVGEEPVQFRIRRALPGTGGVLECNPTSSAVQLTGSPRLTNDSVRSRTILSFNALESLPSGSCYEVEVTSRVRDLSGRSAAPQVFRFTLVEGQQAPVTKTFDFQNDDELDRSRSAGEWAGGAASFVTLGGDGRHGDFDVEDGARVTDVYFVFDTDSQLITRKPTATITADETVTNGTFFFTNFVVPQGWTIEFRGSNPVRLNVRGECRIEGTVLMRGKAPATDFQIRAPSGHVSGGWAGGAGAAGGPFGGSGGDGAFGCDGTGNPNQPAFNNFEGFHGDDLNLPMGHPLAASAAGTGGRGGPLFPAHGNQATLAFPAFTFNVDTGGMAGGGGFVLPGSAGSVTRHGTLANQPPLNPNFIGPSAAGGTSIPFTNLPSPLVSSDYFCVGGSGGGGGGSHSVFASSNSAPTNGDPFKYRSGLGGAGGGGCARFRIGGRFEMSAASRIDVSGGDGAVIVASQIPGTPALSGGGSGGTALIQLGSAFDFSGLIDVSGGTGSRYSGSGNFAVTAGGGDGAPGFLRVETPVAAPALSRLGNVDPPAVAQSAGLLAESDDFTGFQSIFVSTGAIFPPTYVRYVVEADVDGVPTTFSDDPAVGVPALRGAAPIVFLIQGAPVAITGELTGVPAAWRTQVGAFQAGVGNLNADAFSGYRWQILFDRTMANSVVVRAVRIEYRI
jgi:hypothetical protein